MSELFLSAVGCLSLGIVTTLHPCPMTTNSAAISWISGVSAKKKKQVISTIAFGIGYVFALVGVALVLNYSMITIPKLSIFLQNIISAFLGPVLVLAGMLLSGLIDLTRFYKGVVPGKRYWKNRSIFYSFLLGAILALTFCPATAALYFGVMIPLSIKNNQIILFPLIYAAGAFLPIAVTSIFIHLGFVITLKEKWISRMPIIAGWVLIILGVFITFEQLYL